MAYHRIAHIVWVLGVVALFLAAPARAAEEKAILVLDASGSMWGQIDDEAKITIAKRVLDDLLNDLPSERMLGLIAYGHNRKGDCSDIEELAPVGADRSAISAAVKGINPKGKTPMTASIKLAAEKLRYTEERATVILISDGIETCAPDPCAAASALEQAGVDFTAHVIGFDVKEENEQAQLRCIAENTGGRFVSASNAGELSAALQETMVNAPVAAVQGSTITLRATELEGGLVIDKGLHWRVIPSAGGDDVVTEDDSGVVDAAIEPGEYDITVTRPADGLNGEAKGVVIRPGASKTVTIALTFPVEATVRVEPETQSVAGTNVKVYFEGPARQGDFISIADKDSTAGSSQTYSYVKNGAPAELRLPVEPGTYEIRYVLGRPYRVLANLDYVATPATATLTAPDTAVTGGEVKVEFTGPPPGSGDYVTITKPEAEAGKYNSYAYTKNGSPGTIRMPLEAGDYEIRFIQGNKKILARRPITVSEAVASVSAPETALAGESIAVEFTGPEAASGDFITVTPPEADEKAYNSYAYARNGSPATVRMPLEAGDYEIRYVQDSTKVIARQAISILEAPSSVTTKDTAIAGETVSVAFTGPPAGAGDFITVTLPDAPQKKYNAYAYTKNGSPAEIRMPIEAGAYEIRYVQNNEKVIATQPITITPATASLDAPDSAVAGDNISVRFTGPPAGAGDFITVTLLDAPEGAYTDYAYTKNGSPAKIRMPAEAGSYEIRFVQANNKVLARRPISVRPAQ